MRKKSMKHLLGSVTAVLTLALALSLTSFADSAAVEVTTEQEFITALKDQNVDTIEFANDIVMQTATVNIEVGRTNPDLVIDGNGYSLTEYYVATKDSGKGLRVTTNTSSTLTSITLKNFDMINGGNGYGTIYIADGTRGQKPITMNYESITYEGPKLTFNPYGSATFTDTNITIDNAVKAGGGQAGCGKYTGEIAEVMNVSISGENTFVKKMDGDSATDSLFRIKSNGTGIIITPGSTVNASNESKDACGAAGFVYNEGTKSNFEVGENANFTYTGYRVFNVTKDIQKFTVGSDAVVAITVDADKKGLGNCSSVLTVNEKMTVSPNADFNLTTNGNNKYAALGINSSLVIEEDAAFKVLALNNKELCASYPVVSVGAGSGCCSGTTQKSNVAINNPELVLIYNSNENAKSGTSAFGYRKEGSLNITASSIEYWTTPNAAGLPDDLNTDTVSRVWVQDDAFDVSAVIKSGNAIQSLNTNNYNGTEVLDAAYFDFKNENVIRINGTSGGGIIVEESAVPTIDTLYERPMVVKGKGIAGSLITVTLPDGRILTTTVTISDNWAILLPSGVTLKTGDIVSVTQTEIEKTESAVITTTILGGSF